MNSPNVIWSPFAEAEYLNILKYIIGRWSIKEANNFDHKTNDLIKKITSHHHLCPKSDIVNLRKCVITAQPL